MLNRDDLALEKPLSERMQSFAENLSTELRKDFGEPLLLDDYIRIRLPDSPVKGAARNSILTLYSDAEKSTWIGIENPAREKLSFHWSPILGSFHGWVLDLLNDGDRKYWHLLSSAIWCDLTHGCEHSFPFADADARNVNPVRNWGTETQLWDAIQWATQVAPGVTARLERSRYDPDQQLTTDILRSICQNPKISDMPGLACFVLLDYLCGMNI